MQEKLKFWMKATRTFALPVIIIPVLLGAAGAFSWNDMFDPLWFIITLIGAMAAHLFSNMINDLWDYRNGADDKAEEIEDGIPTNSGLLTSGALTDKTFASVTWALLAVAVVCGVIIGAVRGWPVLIIGAIGALIAYFYVAPPLKFGYRGKGYSEVAIFIAFGILPVMGSYFVQTGTFDVRAFFLSFPVGILTTLVLYNHHFLHKQADEAAGKRTLVVVLGERKGLILSKWFTILAFLTVILCVIVGALPWYGLISLAGFIPLIQVLRSLGETNSPESYPPFMGAALRASVRCGGLQIICLLLQGFLT
ncbi:prenyltransferase [Salibacterium salarium]|uniref:Prenyltransferase n=1 Tax=Salibacterium salarium TaxID=284579 RepID=A0A3R9P4S7_9BACI|nr:prenyltransferase [Salibacterium salarium]RSL30291.1 prenyltransferase [Salibacterium salarium]